MRNLISNLWATVRWRIRDRSRHYAARLKRLRLTGTTFVGITGSAGKTTTKDLVTAILSVRDHCHSYLGSGNDNETVDKMVLATHLRHRFSIVEVGATKPGFLDRSVRTLRPQIGVLTLIAQEHYGVFRTLEAVAEEKRKLIDALPRHGTAVLNIDDPLVRAIGDRCRCRIVWVGEAEEATIRLLDASSAWPEPLTLRIRFDGAEHLVRTRLHGVHLALPVLCALGVGIGTGMPFTDAIAALGSAEPAQGRMQIEDDGHGVVFVRDDFKAPEWSFLAPLQFMRGAHATRKLVVIGSISDSNIEERRRYARAVRSALEVAELVILIGSQTLSISRARAIRDDGSLRVFMSVRDAARFLRKELRAGDLVLLKGTNKQDHLVRLLLDRHRPVQCWDMTCGREVFCGVGCSLVYRQPDDVSSIGTGHDGSSQPGSASALETDAHRRDSLVVVGLGNPGDRYADTPHNVGQLVLDTLAHANECTWEARPEGLFTTLTIDGIRTILFKPSAFVNLSGPLLARFLINESRTARDCVVVLDDMDLPLGSARLKREGSDAGHKGMRSIVTTLGTNEIPRIRIGVRRDGDTRRAKDLVLEYFSTDDRKLLAAGLKGAEERLRRLIREMARDSGQGQDSKHVADIPG